MKNDLSKYFVPGVIDYTSRYVEALDASFTASGVKTTNNEVLINLNNISSIEKKSYDHYNSCRSEDFTYWKVYMQGTGHHFQFDYHTGLAIVLLWKRHFREGGFNRDEELKLYEKQLRREENA
jgi:hypothetical protein